MRISVAVVSLLACFCLPLRAEPPKLSVFSAEKMDPTVAPGADFYRYANGTWLKQTAIPDDQVTWSPTTELTERNLALLHGMLDELQAPREERSTREKQVGDFYAAALDDQRAEALGAQPLAPDFAKIDALTAKSELHALLAELHERGIGGMFNAYVAADSRKSDTYAFQVDQSGLGLPDRDYYFAKDFAKQRAAYRTHIEKLERIAGVPAERTKADAGAILAIEEALAKSSRKLEDLTDPVANYHKLTLPELQKLTPSFDWSAYLAAGHAAPLETVIVGQPEFLKALEQTLTARSLDEWKSYLRWHALVGLAPLLHDAAAQESFAFHGTVLSGQPKLDARWKRAIRHTDDSLGEALGQLYMDRYFPATARDRMHELVENVRAVYGERLQKVPWMSDATRQEALKKFGKFGAKLGGPTQPRDYSAVEIRRDDFVGNVQRAATWETRREMARIGQPVDRAEWEMTAPTVNAYYSPTMNEIVFPAGILQPPFFDPAMDDAVNYGATAATIGHEMTHGFDNEGRKYDSEGNLRDWWSKADAREFDRRAQRLIEQFNAYQPLPGTRVNGKLTLAENIADLGGLSIAFEALQRALSQDPAKRHPIDGLTPEQRFFIAYAQSWAARERPEHLRKALTTDTHAPDIIRGYAPLVNLPEFYQAFNIKPGAKLWLPANRRAVIW